MGCAKNLLVSVALLCHVYFNSVHGISISQGNSVMNNSGFGRLATLALLLNAPFAFSQTNFKYSNFLNFNGEKVGKVGYLVRFY